MYNLGYDLEAPFCDFFWESMKGSRSARRLNRGQVPILKKKVGKTPSNCRPVEVVLMQGKFTFYSCEFPRNFFVASVFNGCWSKTEQCMALQMLLNCISHNSSQLTKLTRAVENWRAQTSDRWCIVHARTRKAFDLSQLSCFYFMFLMIFTSICL